MSKLIHKHFDGVGVLTAHLRNAQTQSAFGESSMSGSYGFTHTNSYEEAENLMLRGDHELQKQLEQSGVAQLRANLNKYMPKRQIYSSVVGCAANVPAFLAGTPNSMINIRKKMVRQKVVDLVYCISVNAGVSTSSIIDAASKLVMAIMRIEAGGVRVNLSIMDASESRDDKVVFTCKIKQAGQALDTLKMVYPLVHPSMLRRQCFRLMETTKGVPSHFAGGYGRAITDETTLEELLNDCKMGKVDKVLSYRTCSTRTVEQLIEYINEK